MATSFTSHPSLRDILSTKYFGPPSIGDNINKELRKSSNIITQNIENSVKLLMGNNYEPITNIPMAVNLLLHRNYPTQFDKNGKRINKSGMIQISVPDIFLSKSTNFIGPPPNMAVSVNPNILKEEMKKKNLGKTTVIEKDMKKQSCVHVRHLTTREMFDSGGTLKGYVANYSGDEVEKNLYSKLRTIFQDNGEEYGLFQSYDLYDFGLLRSCCIHLKVTFKKDPRKPKPYDGKYKLQSSGDSDKLPFYKQIWLHENGKWKIWYNLNKGWIIDQIQKNGVYSEVLFGKSINVQCPHKIEKWDDGVEVVNVCVKKSNFREKDLIAINKTRRSVFMVSCKRSLFATHSNAIENSKDELNDGWERIKKWFSSSNEKNWKFIPLIYYINGSFPPEFSFVEDYIIKGKAFYIMLSKMLLHFKSFCRSGN